MASIRAGQTKTLTLANQGTDNISNGWAANHWYVFNNYYWYYWYGPTGSLASGAAGVANNSYEADFVSPGSADFTCASGASGQLSLVCTGDDDGSGNVPIYVVHLNVAIADVTEKLFAVDDDHQNHIREPLTGVVRRSNILPKFDRNGYRTYAISPNGKIGVAHDGGNNYLFDLDYEDKISETALGSEYFRWDGDQLYGVGSSPNPGSLKRYNTTTGAVEATWSLGVYPAGKLYGINGTLALFSDGAGNLYVLRLSDGTCVSVRPGTDTAALVGNYAYVADNYDVYRYDLTDIDSIPAPDTVGLAKGNFLYPAPDGSQLLVLDTEGGNTTLHVRSISGLSITDIVTFAYSYWNESVTSYPDASKLFVNNALGTTYVVDVAGAALQTTWSGVTIANDDYGFAYRGGPEYYAAGDPTPGYYYDSTTGTAWHDGSTPLNDGDAGYPSGDWVQGTDDNWINTADPGHVYADGAPSGGGPTISGTSSSSGYPGQDVTITGSGFTGTTDVDFNGTPASFTVDSDTQITATIPEGATTGPITVTTPSGTNSTGDFTVTTPPPTVSGVTPGTAGPGETVTITGSDFTDTTGVTIDGVAADYTVVDDNTITATVPDGLTEGTVNVVVSNASGPSEPSSFTYRATTAQGAGSMLLCF